MKFALACLLLAFRACGPASLSTLGVSLSGLASSAFSQPAAPQPPAAIIQPLGLVETKTLICEAARKHGLSAAFVKSIVATESNFNPAAVSAKGAIGLMQLMPETAKQYGVDPWIPEQNVEGGTHYLRELMNRYRNHRDSLKKVIAAYNAGPGMVDRYHGVPPVRETRQYVVKVLGFLRRFEREG